MRIGSAILRQRDPEDYRLIDWDKQMGQSYPEVENEVSKLLRDRFTFSCFTVPTSSERLSLESGLIALLAQNPIGKPTPAWLGRITANVKIHDSGLWNSKAIDGTPLSYRQFLRLKELIG